MNEALDPAKRAGLLEARRKLESADPVPPDLEFKAAPSPD
jgi:hypothetical protein